jgi:hypothetical protein
MLRWILARCAPMTIAAAAFFLVSALGSLVDRTFLGDGAVPASVAPFAEARTGPRLDPAPSKAMLALLQERRPHHRRN